MIGGGSLPLEKMPTLLVGVKLANLSTTDVSICLREAQMPIICRIQDDELIFDLRTVLPEQDREIIKVLIDISQIVKK